MKRRMVVLALVLAGLPGCAWLMGDRRPAMDPIDVPAGAEPVAAPGPAVRLPALRDELLRRVAVDQAVREAWTAAGMADKATIARMAAVDLDNTTRMKAIVAEHGWPTVALVGPEAVKAAFLLVQHADGDPAFQAACLPHVTAAAARGELEKQHVALLTDRVLLAQGKPQRYGTQFVQKNGEWVPNRMEDPANVDRRRQAMDLMPLAEYKAMLLKYYGKPQADPIPPVPKASPAHAAPVR